MYWDAELVPYCGGTYRVLNSVTSSSTKRREHAGNEESCVVLDTVVCRARYSPCECCAPRRCIPIGREIWLERVEPDSADASGAVVRGDDARFGTPTVSPNGEYSNNECSTGASG